MADVPEERDVLSGTMREPILLGSRIKMKNCFETMGI